MEPVSLTPITDALIKRVAQRIVEACDPDALYLFGSAARGETTPGSDLDLLVVLPLPEGVMTHEIASDLQRLFRGWRVPLDIIVRTPEQFARERRLPGFASRTAVREGRLLHGQPLVEKPPAHHE